MSSSLVDSPSGKLRPDFVHCPEEMGAHRTRLQSEKLRDFFQRPAFVVA